MKQFQKRTPITSCGLPIFRVDYPEQLILEDEDTGSLHIYRLADNEFVPRVIVAFGNDYAFSRFATDEEDKAWREQLKTGKVHGEEDEPECVIADELEEVINSIGSTISS